MLQLNRAHIARMALALASSRQSAADGGFGDEIPNETVELFFNTALHVCLEAHDWKFATKEAYFKTTEGGIDEVKNPFYTRCIIPTDFVKLCTVEKSSYDHLYEHGQRPDYDVFGGYIQAGHNCTKVNRSPDPNEEDIWCVGKYIFFEEGMKAPASFQAYLAAELATLILPIIKDSTQDITVINQLSQKYFMLAKDVDTTQVSETKIQSESWIMDRVQGQY